MQGESERNPYRRNKNCDFAFYSVVVENSSTTVAGAAGIDTAMAFIRKRGQSYYLVHNVRQDGEVRQIHLACLGRRPRINDQIMHEVMLRHPFVDVDWQNLRHKLSRQLVQPAEMRTDFLQELLASARDLNLDLAAMHFPSLEVHYDRHVVHQFVTALKLLRTTVDVKLRSRRLPGYDEKSGRGRR